MKNEPKTMQQAIKEWLDALKNEINNGTCQPKSN